jgi:hypothetical protein
MSGDRGGGAFGGDAMAFGMMSSLRTGNPAFDMLVVVMVPLILAVSTGLVDNSRPWLWRMWQTVRRLGGTEYTRTVRREKRINTWGDEERDKEEHNHILHKAITLYLSAERPAELKGSKTVAILLTAVGEEKASGKYSWNKSFGNTSEQLEQYAVTMACPNNTWVQVEQGLWFMRKVSDDNEEEEGQRKDGKDGGGDGGSKQIIDFDFRCCTPPPPVFKPHTLIHTLARPHYAATAL